MSTLTRFFFTPAPAPRDPWITLAWWEARRPAYNLFVGAAGAVTIVIMTVVDFLPPRGLLYGVPFTPPLALIGLYAVLANAFYSLGALVEYAVRRSWGEDYAPVGPALLRYGFAFSVGLTLLPITVAALAWGARLLAALGLSSLGR